MKKLIAMLALLVFTGCAPKMTILLDGQPIPNYAYVLTNPATNLTLDVTAAHYIKKGGVSWPVYASVSKINKINPDKTKFILINVKVYNPKKVSYRLMEYSTDKEIITWDNERQLNFYTIYEGKQEFKKLSIYHNIENNKFQRFQIEIWDMKGRQLITIGDFAYKMLRPENRNEGR
ncbi:MAG: hypothetical protein ACFFG0_01635 [Candidatus Thorarchaeota archaeon]